MRTSELIGGAAAGSPRVTRTPIAAAVAAISCGDSRDRDDDPSARPRSGVEPERGARLVDQLPAARVAKGGILRHRTLQDRVDLRRQTRVSLAGNRNRILEVRIQRGDVRRPVVREAARQRFEEQAAECVLVSATVERLAADLLGRDVVDRAQPLPVGRAALRGPLRQPEVGEVGVLSAVLFVDQDVRRLHVAMDEPAPVCGVECIGDLSRNRDRPRRVERTLATEQRLQIGAGHESHGDEQAPVFLTGLVDRDHVRVVEPSSEAGLAEQPLPKPFVVGERRQEELQRDRALEARIERAIHLAHAAAADELVDPVAGDECADWFGPRSSRSDSHALRGNVEARRPDGTCRPDALRRGGCQPPHVTRGAAAACNDLVPPRPSTSSSCRTES